MSSLFDGLIVYTDIDVSPLCTSGEPSVYDSSSHRYGGSAPHVLGMASGSVGLAGSSPTPPIVIRHPLLSQPGTWSSWPPAEDVSRWGSGPAAGLLGSGGVPFTSITLNWSTGDPEVP